MKMEKNQANSGAETEKFDEIWAFMGFRQKLVMI